VRVIIAGSRTLRDGAVVRQAMIDSGFAPTVVLCGDCRGADALGELWAYARGIPVHHFPAQWNRYGKRAGPIRNATMVSKADALVAVWDGTSFGTADVIRQARERGLKVHMHVYTASPRVE